MYLPRSSITNKGNIMSYIKHMGKLEHGGAIGVPDYQQGIVISWVDGSGFMQEIGGSSRNIQKQYTIPQDGWVIGRLGATHYSVNGIWVNQGQESYNGEGCIPVKQGDILGCAANSPSDHVYFYPAVGG